jgi:hypothetical protein
VGVKEVEAGI